ASAERAPAEWHGVCFALARGFDRFRGSLGQRADSRYPLTPPPGRPSQSECAHNAESRLAPRTISENGTTSGLLQPTARGYGRRRSAIARRRIRSYGEQQSSRSSPRTQKHIGTDLGGREWDPTEGSHGMAREACRAIRRAPPHDRLHAFE